MGVAATKPANAKVTTTNINMNHAISAYPVIHTGGTVKPRHRKVRAVRAT
jgi:hypothetical protein